MPLSAIMEHPERRSQLTVRSQSKRNGLHKHVTLKRGKDIRRCDMSGLYEFICGGAMGALIALLFFGLGCNIQRKLDKKEDEND
jgi:hypothetical protein